MSLILLLEGETEHKALPGFIRRWLEAELGSPVKLRPVNLKGSGNYVRELPRKVSLYLEDYPDTKGIFGLLDIYGLQLPYPKGVTKTAERVAWAKAHLEQAANTPLFRQHFAVHDVEAWLLSDPSLLHREVSKALPKKAANPEAVNFNTPPAELLGQLYLSKAHREYKKSVDGPSIFNRLDPKKAAEKCPALAALLADMLATAKA